MRQSSISIACVYIYYRNDFVYIVTSVLFCTVFLCSASNFCFYCYIKKTLTKLFEYFDCFEWAVRFNCFECVTRLEIHASPVKTFCPSDRYEIFCKE